MPGLLSRLVLGDFNTKEIRRYQARVPAINALEPEIEKLSDEDIRRRTGELRVMVEQGAELDDVLTEAFALVREAGKRALGMRIFDVQLIGGMVLHQGRVAEMKTGEGKTLVATLPAYLNALTGKGVHIVTVNDYLARRDAEWMGKVYHFLGLSVGVILHDLEPDQRREAYACDITYGTNAELGFDFLRDNMVVRPEDLTHRGFHYAIVDEVDSILIDEARTPLIISGPGLKSTEWYARFASIVPTLVEGEDYVADEKAHTVAPTEAGIAKVERLLGVHNLYADAGTDLSHYLMQALKAHALMKRDRDYVVRDNQVIIVDEFTGRMMFGRRYSEGLHQAIEAKEHVKVEEENQTLATITLQNYFRMYKKLAGMTGTAATEEEEFRKIYGLDVIVVPTHKPMIRTDLPDLVYKTEAGKFEAVVNDIAERHARRQPVLVGTISIEKSERLSRMLEKRGIPHQVLNAKHHEREAEIIARAGQAGAVTIATNMAGRGTDIVLGEGVAELGGLHVLGTERHESRRIDNQLRGRSGRQGDPGSSQFYVSLEDDLMRIFGGDNLRSMMDRLGLEDDVPIEHNMLTRGIENAQKRVEARNFDSRKHLLEYDDVMNKQREVIYEQRRRLLTGTDLRENVMEFITGTVDALVDTYCPEAVKPEEWDLEGLLQAAESSVILPGILTLEELEPLDAKDIGDRLEEESVRLYEAKEQSVGPEVMRDLERLVLLRVVDQKWMEHLDAMDDLRDGIGLRAYGQRDPLIEYKMEAYEMFENMVASIREDAVRILLRLEVVQESPEPEPLPVPVLIPVPQAPSIVTGGRVVGLPKAQEGRVGRNDPCPCGSGKKYKKCHGQASA